MKTTRIVALTALLALALGSAGTLVADGLDVNDAKKIVAIQKLEIVKEFDKLHIIQIDPGKMACYKDYNAAVTKAKNAFSACVNNPSPSSPLGKFNAMTNAQLAGFCGSQTLQACVTGVMSAQRTFCNNQTDYIDHLAAAKKVETHCLECDTLNDELEALKKKIAAKGCGHLLLPIRAN